MGGWGSGRRWSSQETTEGYLQLDVRWLRRERALRSGAQGTVRWLSRGRETASIRYRTEVNAIIVSYKHQKRGGEWESLVYPIQLERTPCHYGGSRTWFLCPASGCGKRVAVLYGARIYACRHCRELVYPSQHEGRSERATERAWGILRNSDAKIT